MDGRTRSGRTYLQGETTQMAEGGDYQYHGLEVRGGTPEPFLPVERARETGTPQEVGGERMPPLQTPPLQTPLQAGPELLVAMMQEQQRGMQQQQRIMMELLQTQREDVEMCRREMTEMRLNRAPQQERGAGYKLPKPNLKKLEETDDIENFLATFERVATQYRWPEEVWAPQLAGLLTGKAMAGYAALSAEDSRDYQRVKRTVLHRYDVNVETHRQRFRQDRRKTDESYREWICRITDHFDKWAKDSTLTIREMVIMEQVLKGVPDDLAVWLRERKPTSLDELATLVEDYTLARKREATQPPQKSHGPSTTPTPGRSLKDIPRGTPQGVAGRARVNAAGEKQCFHCRQWGHLMYNCPKRVETHRKGSSRPALFSNTCQQVAWNVDSEKYIRRGELDGRSVQMLIDSGCSLTMVRANQIAPSKIDAEETVPVLCVHGDTESYPTTEVEFSLGGIQRKARVVVAPSLPVPVLLGRDLYDIRDGWKLPETGLLAETRAQRKRREDAVQQRREETVLQRVEPDEDEQRAEPGEDEQRMEPDEDEQRAEPGEDEQRMEPDEEVESMEEVMLGSEGELGPETIPLQATRKEVELWQAQDESLDHIRQVIHVDGQPSERVYFYRSEGLIFRHWQPRGEENEGVKAVEQLVLPVQCRQLVLRLAHDVPMAGHLGTAKTRDRVLQCYYWPGVFGEVAKYCRTCDVCQRSRGKKPTQAPMIPMPVIQKPFTRIAMDIVGPLPKTKRGNRFILTICDYATRYPEAIPLPSIEASRVARELLLLFTRVGVPEEVLTDQGTNFMSTMLEDIYHALQIRRIRTTPYHPQTDGLVERFNGTLKSMIRKFTSRNQKDWDEYLPYLLFSYREVPQETTGFSPFELLYGRRVRGPLDVLRESWTDEQSSKVPVAAHVVEMRDRMEEMGEIVREHAAKAQRKQKSYYDRGTKARTLEVGDQVLVLLPMQVNKLKLAWNGPYQILRQVTPVDYEVSTPGRRQEKKIYHINLLKLWRQPSTPAVPNLLAVIEEMPEDEQDLGPWYPDGESEDAEFDESKIQTPGLTAEEREQLMEVVREFASVFSEVPGRTSAAEHVILVGDGVPIRQKPYRVPYSRRGQVKLEIQKMLDAKVIRPSTSPWASPIVLVDKKDGTIRFCVDYRKVNQVAKFDAYPMPRVEEVLDSIGSAKFITTLDLARGYWQIPLAESSKEISAFTTPYGLYEFEVMPFGLHNAPATFQRMIDHLLTGCEDYSGGYIDDLVIHSQTWEEHLQHLWEVLNLLQRADLTLKVGKCQFGRGEVHYLGHVVGGGKVRPDPSKLKAVAEYPHPRVKKDVRAFLGLVGYYRRFVPQFADVAAPLTDLTKKNMPDNVQWTSDCEEAFQELKSALLQRPVLAVMDPSRKFVLQTDASDQGLGAVLSQEYGESDRPISYASRKLQPRERKYSTIEKECLAIVWALKVYYTYLYGQSFQIQTDHQPLAWLHRMKNTNARLTRWSLAIQPYTFTVIHRQGQKHGNADGLSRGPISDSMEVDRHPSVKEGGM